MGVKFHQNRFIKDLEDNARINVLDSSILIYHLEDVKPYSDLTELLITYISSGAIKSIISTISITELLTKPYAEGHMKKVLIFNNFVQTLPNTEIIAPDFDIACEAASIRGQYKLHTPDAILLATVKQRRGTAFITNDLRLKKVKINDIKIIVFDDYIQL